MRLGASAALWHARQRAFTIVFTCSKVTSAESLSVAVAPGPRVADEVAVVAGGAIVTGTVAGWGASHAIRIASNITTATSNGHASTPLWRFTNQVRTSAPVSISITSTSQLCAWL